MDGIMMKLRVQSPNRKSAAVKERANLNYIATREGVILNEDSAHGLFGKINDMADQGAIESLGTVKHSVGELVKDGTITYRCVLSLKEQDSLRLGIDTPQKWRELTKDNINLIAKGLNISPNNVEYVAAIHMEKGHPHVHITLWDTNQRVKEAFVHPKVANGIRRDITHNVYRDFLSEWYIEKGLSRDKMISMQKELITGIPNDKNNPNGRLPNMRSITAELYDGFITEVDELAAALPKQGRITYKTLTPELKEKLNGIIDRITESNEDFSLEKNRYLFYTEKIAKLDGTKQAPDKVNKAKGDMYNRLGNVLLNEIKNERKAEYLKERQEAQIGFDKARAQNALFQMFRVLSRGTADRQQSFEHQRQELSLEGKKDILKKTESITHINWEEER